MVKKLDELNLIDNFLFEALASHPEIGAAFGRDHAFQPFRDG